MTETKKPNAADLKKQQQAVAEFLATGIDFDPFTIDVGDGREWEFKPDPMPAETVKIQSALNAIRSADTNDADQVEKAFDVLTSVIRDQLLSDDQKKEFPRPNYGTRALTFLGMHLIIGKSGLPTSPA